ncbi:hypothetical protein BHE74_00026800 [Ensete ventricosum]|nr:hypothetical protein GW17_00019145 [Ensete ventricosum]RWW65862.1 hypothetical protein BHE74_00026800 [Ensete ventricosum]RZS14387.1 hypothetical protein BHM03_00046061 [Ensete ventricosum]
MWHLVLPLEDEAVPRPRAGRRGGASFFARRQGCAFVPVWGDETSPRCLVAARKTRCCLVPVRGDARYYPVVGGPHTGILSDQYIPPVLGDTDRNREP